MKTRHFATYNDDIVLDKKIKYIKNRYNDYYIDNFQSKPRRKIVNKSVTVTKNKDYKIGVYTSNDTNEDIVIYSTVYNVSMWID